MLPRQPELKAEWEKLQADARLAREVAPLVGATQSASGEFPAYARERLQTKVRQALGEARPASTIALRAKWWLLMGFAGTSVTIVALILSQLPTSTTPLVEVAMLDSAGPTRGADTNEVVLLQQQWRQRAVRLFEKPEDLKAWEQTWPNANAPLVKVIYDRAAGEVRVWGSSEDGAFKKTILVEKDLASALREAEAFIQQQLRR